MALIADIGATNTRCALLDDKGRVLSPETFDNADFTGVEGLLGVYLDHRRASDQPRRAALAIAAPVAGDQIRMLNIDWELSQTELKAKLGLHRLIMINDFAAIAWGLPTLTANDLQQLCGGHPVSRSPMAVLGPGSGLGVASLVPSTDGWNAVASEGGHTTLAASNEDEAAVIARIRTKLGHCSAERVLSGPGLVELYKALAEIAGRGTPTIKAADVTGLARQGEPLAKKTVDMFFAFLATQASNLVLTLGARGGLYIAGGVVPKLLEFIDKSPFKERFVAKGRYRDYMQAVPAYLITDELPAFRGLRYLLGYR